MEEKYDKRNRSKEIESKAIRVKENYFFWIEYNVLRLFETLFYYEYLYYKIVYMPIDGEHIYIHTNHLFYLFPHQARPAFVWYQWTGVSEN